MSTMQGVLRWRWRWTQLFFISVLLAACLYRVVEDRIAFRSPRNATYTSVLSGEFRTTKVPTGTDSSSVTDESNIAKILSFWFEHDEGVAKWFVSSPGVDQECQVWAPLAEAAREGKLTAWTKSPDGTLALLLLLDQIPRNIYRGTPQAFASDGQALNVALDAISNGIDRKVELGRQMFFYLPIMHQESLLAQVGCLGLYQGMLARTVHGTELHEQLKGSLRIAQAHVDVIKQFGRFPGRNKALGRQSTWLELEYLKSKGQRGF